MTGGNRDSSCHTCPLFWIGRSVRPRQSHGSPRQGSGTGHRWVRSRPSLTGRRGSQHRRGRCTESRKDRRRCARPSLEVACSCTSALRSPRQVGHLWASSGRNRRIHRKFLRRVGCTNRQSRSSPLRHAVSASICRPCQGSSTQEGHQRARTCGKRIRGCTFSCSATRLCTRCQT